MKNVIKQIVVLLFVALIVFFLFYNCTGSKNEETTTSTTETKTGQPGYTNECYTLYQEALLNDSIILSATEVNVDQANKAIKAFTDFSTYCKTDTIAPIYLLKAGQIATTINNLPLAKASFEKVVNDFPDFSNRGAAMFLLAQLYDDPRYLNNEEKARDIYDRIISTYPATDWSRNAEAAREMLGKSDEQIIQEFLKKKKNKK